MSALLVKLRIDEPIAGSEQEYDHEYAPCHCKSGERCPELVSLGRAPYFLKEFNHIVVV